MPALFAIIAAHSRKLRDAEAAERAVVEAGRRADRKHQSDCPSGRW
jgi:hypothetical protein